MDTTPARFALGAGVVAFALCFFTYAQETPAPDAKTAGDSGRDLDKVARYSATGLALPNTPIDADLKLSGDKANSWRTGETQKLLLNGGVKVEIGSYHFAAQRAVVSLTPQNIPGPVARQVAIYLENVTSIGGGPVSQEASRLLVTAVLRGSVKLETSLMVSEPADNDALVTEAAGRMDRYFASIAQNTAPLPPGGRLVDDAELAKRTAQHELIARQTAEASPLTRIPQPKPGIETDPGVPPPDDQAAAEAPRVDFQAGKIVSKKSEDGKEWHTLLVGNITVMYTDTKTGHPVSLRADKAVLFSDQSLLGDLGDEGDAGAATKGVKGVYLEDNVIISDGQYTLRGPRVYYDLKTEKAIVLDAVFFTWDVKRQLPLYVRADEIRQVSRKQWSAGNARFTTSEFGEPHFAIGVNKLTITQRGGEGVSGFHVQAEGIKPMIGTTPVFYWPSLSGDATSVPIQSVEAGYDSRLGGIARTRWDLFALLNKDAPTGVEASLLVDGYTERGPGIGVDADYDVDKAFGELDAYYLHDSGTDEPGGRHEVTPETEDRGRVVWRHRHYLPDNWEATVELSIVSDPTFLEEFFRSDAQTEKEYESLIYLKKQRDDWAFTFLAKYDLMDFVPQTDLLQTRGDIGGPDIGYTTNKLPELEYYRIATPLWEDRLTWYSENRVGVLQLNLPNDTPRERGFSSAEATALFGVASATQSFKNRLEMAGYDDDMRIRGDTRQEVQMPLAVGPVNVTPYAIGRITAYDQDFSSYAGEDDEMRFWGGVGTKFATSFTRSFDGVESRLLDVHRLRHVVEPSINLFLAGTTIEQQDLPVYDYDVESLAEGGQAKFGLRNTLQTQRGGEGRWHSVDWLRVDSDFVMAEDDTVRESPIAHFYDYRPEHSLVGDHLWNEAAWQVTETLAAVGNTNYSFDSDEMERWNVGLLMDHTPRLASFVQYRNIHALNLSVVRYGFDYLLTPKYHVGFAHTYDLDLNRHRGFTVNVTRRLPRWLAIVTFEVDDIENITSAGFALVPEGFGGKGNVKRNPFLFDQR